MGKHIFLKVLAITIIALVVGIYFSSISQREISHTGYPWQVDNLKTGHVRVFNLTIGQSTLTDAEQLFKEKSDIVLFVPKESSAVVEAYFNKVKISELKSKMVMAFTFSEDETQAMFGRGVRISTLDSGTRKVTLSDDDAEWVRKSIITSITYLPSIHLSVELIEKRFGKPAEKISDTESDAVHWLYPDKGLDIVLSETDKEVIQYVMPKDFQRLIKPLKKTIISK